MARQIIPEPARLATISVFSSHSLLSIGHGDSPLSRIEIGTHQHLRAAFSLRHFRRGGRLGRRKSGSNPGPALSLPEPLLSSPSLLICSLAIGSPLGHAVLALVAPASGPLASPASLR